MPRRTLALVALLLLGACVSKGTHEEVLTTLAEVRADREATVESLQAELAAERQAAAEAARRAEAEIRALEARIAELEDQLAEARRLHEQAVTRFDEARTEVYRLETVLNERGTEYARLQQRLQSLSAIEREVRERNRIYRDVLDRFASLIDGGRLSVSIARGRLVIQLPQDVLFPSGSATLVQEGRRTIEEVGAVLTEIDDRSFQVEGHTDNVPISTERFPSNWELSTARALSVVRLLVQSGLPPESVSGAGYGEYQPVASNETAEGRRLNRRIEIVMLPNLDVIAGTQISG